MRIGSALVIFVVLLVLSGVVYAAENPTVTLDVENQPIEQAMAELGKKAGVQIVCEAGVKADITAHFASMELDKMLDTVTRTNSLRWMKLYIPAESEEAPRMDQLKARADAIAAVAGSPIGVYDPATGKQTVLVEQAPSAPAVSPEKLGLKPVYYVYRPKAEAPVASAPAQDAAVRYQALEAEKTQLLAQMTPEQQIAAKQQEMATMLQLTPEARQQMMLAEWKARESMDPAMRDQYRQAMRETFQRMREQGLLPDRGWRPDGERRDRRPEGAGPDSDGRARRNN